ncbi:TlpA family protein disulfide reductase [Kineosporia sp. J2-2]|uniref:TlpA family protein disulfide reductase n=1 Tax=Kineosporia corallincola TaxID=2835133 RepID=A0ABS5T9K1_9ACTN|nr:TlpA disulfide reductase family protein [Kineosporia corallincola]MBT0767750.1 TlpA family protein disulfide reductase [Kineosporia corallincola]
MFSQGRRRAVPAALAVAALLTVAGCSGSSSSDGTSVDGGALQVIPAADRKAPIEMSGTTVDGEKLDISTLRGKPLVMNVWGSWCGPCRTEAPALQAAYEELGDSTSFVGIAFRDTETGAKTHEKEFGITYPSLFDEGSLLLNLNGAVTSQSIPVTLILDEQGRIAGRYVGTVTKVTLMDLVEDVEKSSEAA